MADYREQSTDAVVKAAGVAAVAADPALVVALSPNSPMPLAVLTKGTQGATGVATQNLKDAGRVNIAISCYQAAGILTTEGLFAAATFAISRDGAAPTTGQQFTVTAGKKFRIQTVSLSSKDTSTTASTSKVTLRYSGAGGVISNTSSILGMWDIGDASLTAGAYLGPYVTPIPDGMELISGSTFGFTNLASTAGILHTITINGFEY